MLLLRRIVNGRFKHAINDPSFIFLRSNFLHLEKIVEYCVNDKYGGNELRKLMLVTLLTN